MPAPPAQLYTLKMAEQDDDEALARGVSTMTGRPLTPAAPAPAPTPAAAETPAASTVTAREQARVERMVGESYARMAELVAMAPDAQPDAPVFDGVPLAREEHIAYMRSGLERLPAAMSSLDASRPWLCYWMVHGLELLGSPVDTACSARLTVRAQSPLPHSLLLLR